MGASHATGRIVEPFYRRLGIDAVAIPLSEQLTAPLPLGDKTVIVTSQSGESAELIRWLEVEGKRDGVYGMTLDPHSTLARAGAVPSRERRSGGRFRRYAQPVGYTGAARRDTRGAWRRPHACIAGASIACRADPTSGRPSTLSHWSTWSLRLGDSYKAWPKPSRLGSPNCAASRPLRLKGVSSGMARPEMLGPKVGVVLVRSSEAGASLVASSARLARGSQIPRSLEFRYFGRPLCSRRSQSPLATVSGSCGRLDHAADRSAPHAGFCRVAGGGRRHTAAQFEDHED